MIEYVGVSGGSGCEGADVDLMGQAPYIAGGMAVLGLVLLFLFRRS